MPELKRIFNAGKMNRDLDDRLVPPGEYREALNVNIGRSEGQDVGAVENLLGNSLRENLDTSGDSRIVAGSTVIGSLRDNGRERIYFFTTTNDSASGRVGDPDEYTHQVWEFEQITNTFNLLAAGDWLNFHTGSLITGVNLLEDLLFWTDDRNEPRRINIDRARQDSAYYDSDDVAAVIKAGPISAPGIFDLKRAGDTGVTASTFLTDKLPRFAYRYQFEDGEYSVISPFTQIVYASGGGALPDADFQRALLSGDFPTFDNDAREVTLRAEDQAGINPVTTTVEFLYKDTTNNNIYIIGEGTRAERTNAAGDVVVGFEYTYRSQDPFRTLTSDQLTRVYDAVPRRAKSQEIAGGRLVYGNYLENYDLPANFDFSVEQVRYNPETGTSPLENDFQLFRSVKTRRTYQVGVVLADRFGRTSPVLLSDSGRDTQFVPNDDDGMVNRLRLNFQTTAGIRTTFPDWAHSYRIVVKQREQEYYNVVARSTATANLLQRNGDNVNKIPYDQTQANVGTVRPTNVKLYPAGEDDLVTPQGIVNTTGNLMLDGLAANTNYVFETEPVTSELDIFFETSTGGLISDIPDNNNVDIDFTNCHRQRVTDATADDLRIELNRIRAGFNEPFFDIGVRAHAVQENFSGEERRSATMIHSSGLFNSRTNVNQLNQFNESEGGLTINLDPSDGSIQKLFAEDTQLLIWQEDKVSRSPVDKDFIYSAEGGQVPVTSNTQFLGTIAPYAGEYGISRDPASFAVYGTSKVLYR